jgi:hypothetical protein
MKHMAWTLIAVLGLVGACGGDDDDDDDVSGIDAAAGGPDAAAGAPDAAAGTPDAPAATRAEIFCDEYETNCGFGGANRFADLAACLAAFDGFTESRKTCVEMHVGFASGDPTTHCPHAMGQAPCN